MGLGKLTTLLLFTGLAALHGQTTFTNSTTITIPSGGSAPIVPSPYPSNITVSGLSGTVSKVTVTLSNMSVNSPDLDMMLVAPDGKKLVFLSDSGNGSLITGVTITIDDAAANQAPAVGGGAWTNGATYRPTNNGTGDTFASPAPSYDATTESASGVSNTSATGTLALFNGINPNGTWSLYVVDDVPDASSRSIGGWSITITTLSNAATTTVITSSVNPSFTSGAGSSVTFTATVTSGGNPVTVGSVNFLNGATPIAMNVALNASGQASATTTITSEGRFTISANYTGATGFATSSGSLTQEVNNPTTVSGNLFCNPGTLTISPSSNPYPQKIFVSGLSGTLSTVKVRLNGISHSFPTDIDALLVAPDTTRKMVIMSDTGATGNIILDDAAANQLTATTTAGGTFRPTDITGAGNETFPAPAPAGPYSLPAPTGGATLNSTFGGVNPNGTWSLYLVDDVPGVEAASMSNGYCLDFTTTADLLTVTTVTSSADPATVGQSVTFTATVQRADNNAPVTSGTVIFRQGSTDLTGNLSLNASGQASFTTSSLAEGQRTITAYYNGVPGAFNVSNGSVTIQVDTATTVNNKTYCNNGGISDTTGTSPTPSQYPSRVLVSSLPGVISTVTASLSGITGFAADFDMLLVGPNANQNFVLFSDAGTGTASGLNITLADSAANALPQSSALSSGTFRPTAYGSLPDATDTFPSPAPSTNIVHAAPSGTATFSSVFGNSNPNGYWSLFVTDDVPGTTWQLSGWCLTFTNTPPDLSISKTHSGNFTQGQTGAQYTITVTNNGPGSTSGTITVVDSLPTGLTATAISGSGWSCTLATLTCTRSDALIAGNSYPAITLTVNVAANASSPLVNSVTVSGSEDNTNGNNTANDSTTIVSVPDLTISKTHSGNFTQGQTGATYTITVTNLGPGATSGTVSVVDTLPTGLTATAITGSGWSCTLGTLTCTRSDALAASQSYPAITLTVNVASNAPASVTNSVTVSGGGEINTSNNSASDPTTINAGSVSITVGTVPAGLSFSVNGASYTSSQTLSFTSGELVTIATTSPQAGQTGERFVFQNWSDSGAISHTVTASAGATFTATFQRETQLTTQVTPSGSGSVSPSGGFFSDTQSVQLTATPANSCFAFGSWSGNAPGGLVNMSTPQTVTATFNSTAATNVTAQVSVVLGGPRLNRATNRYVQVVTLTNNGASLVNANLVLDALSSNASLFSPTGVTGCTSPAGQPYKAVGALAPGVPVQLTLEFTNPSNGAIGYTPRIVAGAGLLP
jgi:uncharacterized repeat protein (TIGR01451 family)